MTPAVVLWITILSGPMDGMAFGIPYETMEDCKGAKNAISSTMTYGHKFICEDEMLSLEEDHD